MTTADQIQANLVAMGFTNSSALAVYNKIAQAVGQIVDNTIAEMSNSQSIIQNLLISEQGLGKPLYYVANALNFQYGDNLIVNEAINPVTGQPYLNLIYAVTDTTKQIIAQAAFTTQVGQSGNVLLFLKVATLNTVTNLLQALTSVQLSAFQAYFQNFEIPGLPVQILSQNANIFDFNATCTYSSAYDLTTLENNIAAALTNFQNTFQFNGILYIGQLQDYIKQNVAGVIDFYVFDTILDGTAFAGSSQLAAGYFDYQGGITANITYVAA